MLSWVDQYSDQWAIFEIVIASHDTSSNQLFFQTFKLTKKDVRLLG